jgi:hypothetical protein
MNGEKRVSANELIDAVVGVASIGAPEVGVPLGLLAEVVKSSAKDESGD